MSGNPGGDASQPLAQDQNVVEICDKLDIQADVYDMVVVASFGGLGVIPLDNDPTVDTDADGGSMMRRLSSDGPLDHSKPLHTFRVHPVFALLGLATPLFSMQMTVLWCLFLSIDLRTPIQEDWQLFQSQPDMKLLFVVKCLMVIVLGNMSLLEFLHALRPFFLAFNPMTWRELQRPHGYFWRGDLGAAICASCCIVSEFMQLTVAYTVLVLSMSIILRADQITEVIFNSLALIFITDLDEKTFEAAASLFHFDMNSYDNMKNHGIKLVSKGDASAKPLTWLPSWLQSKLSWRKEGKANALSYVFAFLALEFLFVRQLLQLYMAVSTQKLPIARDMCVLYAGLHGQNWFGGAWARLIEWSTFAINFREQVEYKMTTGEGALGVEQDGVIPCFSDEFQMMGLSDITQLSW
eukprot:CAMPEP_0178414192 /NCGR_PEP_ID=MMETSP0689_2-20121128/22910_1 /TAXON_ID=160604 /ORGANISM="Amphidinium massartii, Strain CS-259" /LENGTH=408 /DNA_ID=CAMNT_0020035475 /DNA_START=61 /DNA_END=1284 /DNA_ORIENTATION=+